VAYFFGTPCNLLTYLLIVGNGSAAWNHVGRTVLLFDGKPYQKLREFAERQIGPGRPRCGVGKFSAARRWGVLFICEIEVYTGTERCTAAPLELMSR